MMRIGKTIKKFKRYLIKKLIENDDDYIKKDYAMSIIYDWFQYYDNLTKLGEYANISEERLDKLQKAIEDFKQVKKMNKQEFHKLTREEQAIDQEFRVVFSGSLIVEGKNKREAEINLGKMIMDDKINLEDYLDEWEAQ